MEESLNTQQQQKDPEHFLPEQDGGMPAGPALIEQMPQQPDNMQTQPPARKDRRSWQKSVLSYLHDYVYILSAMIVVFLLLFRVVIVEGTSMNNTLLDGDYLFLVGNLFYHDPQPGDVVVAAKDSFHDGEPIVKRVIATEGQTVNIDFERGIVTVDGTVLDEPYIKDLTTLQGGISFPHVVAEGCVFVMGDNRNNSLDSRSSQIGDIDRREIIGKVILLFFPGTNRGTVPRDYRRIGVIGNG